MSEMNVDLPLPTPPFVLCGHCGYHHSAVGVRLCYWIEALCTTSD